MAQTQIKEIASGQDIAFRCSKGDIFIKETDTGDYWTGYYDGLEIHDVSGDVDGSHEQAMEVAEILAAERA